MKQKDSYDIMNSVDEYVICLAVILNDIQLKLSWNIYNNFKNLQILCKAINNLPLAHAGLFDM